MGSPMGRVVVVLLVLTTSPSRAGLPGDDVHNLVDASFSTKEEVAALGSGEDVAKEEFSKMMASEAKADSTHRKGDGEIDSAAVHLNKLMRMAPHKVSHNYELQDVIQTERDQQQAITDEMLSPLSLIQAAEREGSDGRQTRYPFTITQNQAVRRHRRLVMQNREITRDKAKLRAHTPQLTDHYSDPAAPARLKAELKKFDEENEKEHPELKKKKTRTSKQELGGSQDDLKGHTYTDDSEDDSQRDHHETKSGWPEMNHARVRRGDHDDWGAAYDKGGAPTNPKNPFF